MKRKVTLVMLVLAAAAIVAAFLRPSAQGDASKVIYVTAMAQSDFQKLVRSELRYSMLKVEPIGKSGRIRINATGATKAIAEKNLDASIRSLEDWGYTWEVTRCFKEELTVINLAGAVQDCDPRDRPGRWANALNHLFGFSRDVFAP
jgi:hypothetical protein